MVFVERGGVFVERGEWERMGILVFRVIIAYGLAVD